MPVTECNSQGKPGFKWGEQGKCYSYEPGNEDSRKVAKEKAEAQGRAAKANQSFSEMVNDVYERLKIKR
jgi:hypothetical protein